MAVYIEYEAGKQLDINWEELIQRVIRTSLEYIKCPYQAEINVLLVDDSAIRQINKEQRGIDASTDVLSFPMLEFEKPGDFSGVNKTDMDIFSPESGELLLGDIVLSVEKIKEQAASYGHSIERELAFLTMHSMFHLFGYDHAFLDERTIMEAKQNELMEILQITR